MIEISCYMFFASSIELPLTDSSNRELSSINELLASGYNEEELENLFNQTWDISMEGINRDESILMILECDDDGNPIENELRLYQDESFAEYSLKEYHYVIENPKSNFLEDYLRQLTVSFEELDIWCVLIGDDQVDELEVKRINLQDVTASVISNYFDGFTGYEGSKVMVISRNEDS